MTDRVLIIGAGQAGEQIAVSLREEGHEGPITIVGQEMARPYQRPPLSKGFLSGEADQETLEFRAEDFYTDNRIDVKTGESVISAQFDGREGEAVTATGRRIGFDRLALTPGSTPRRLIVEGANLPGVLYLRDLDDARELKSRWPDAQDIIIVGGGFIGLEVAAAAARAGKHVTVVEVADRLIARALSPLTGQFLLDAHRRRGVDIRLNEAVTHIHGSDGALTGVSLSDGQSLPAQIVMVGIGALPRLEIAEQLGLATALGAIVVDEFAETSQPGIVAAGDAVLLPHPLGHDGLVRLESVQNAVDQAKVAAKTLLGRRERYRAVPWFWSDQADLKLQIAGLSAPSDDVILRGDPDLEKYSTLFYRNGVLAAVEAVNSPADYMAVRRALNLGATIPPHLAPDTTVTLKSLVTEVSGSHN